MTTNANIVNILFIVILTCLNVSCFGFLIPYSNTSLLRNKRQAVECSGKLLCNSLTKCVSISQICNRIKDCPDGSDENPEDCKKFNPELDGSCLPFVVDNGEFNFVGDGYESGTLIPNYGLVRVSCKSDYFLHPEKPLLACLDGVWNYPIPQCKPKCPPRISSSAQVNCTLNDKAVDCNEHMFEGTISISTCKNFYTPTFSNVSLSTCIDGNWDNPLIRCEPECGEVTPDGIIYANSSEETKRGEFPWTVAIYRNFNVTIDINCGGSLISPTIVLTVAHCVRSPRYIKQISPSDLIIGAGKFFSEIFTDKDRQMQIRQVKNIYVFPEYKGGRNFYFGDIALIVLTEPFEMTNVVRPVCIDWENKFEAEQLQQDSLGSFAGWPSIDEFGTKRKDLKLLSLRYIDTEQCLTEIPDRRYLPSDKYCNGHVSDYNNDSKVCSGDSGYGLVYDKMIENKQIFFIRGLISTSLNGAQVCSTNSRLTATRVSNYLDFIQNVTQQEEEERYTCQPRISSAANIICSLEGITVDCNERMKEGTIAVSRCKDLYVMTHKQNTTSTCTNGFWDNPPLRCELQGQIRIGTTCPPRTSDAIIMKCLYNDKPVNCNELLLEGAIAISECKNFYTPKRNQNSVSISRCSNGIWNTPLIECEPIQPIKIECGEVISKGVINSVNTANSKRGEFPWHVGVYKNLKKYHRYTCGGSIVTANIVLTAAHCLTDEYGHKFPAEEFFVAAGKYYSDYNAQEDKLAQKRQVKKYHTPPIYKGYETNFAGDLAVVVIKQSFELNTAVQPVCVEWDDKIESQQLQPDNRGSVVGWGSIDPFDITKVSRELKQLNAPYVDVTQCLEKVPQNFRRWVTTDKFCAGYTNGSSICKGDSGGGMVFEWRSNHTQKYFIRGIVSVGPSDTKKSLICDNFKYGAYTLVSFYSKFILDVIKQFHE